MTVLMYVLYLALGVGLTVWVGLTLSRAGRAFLPEVFHGDAVLADSANHLLVVGFYLVNLGFVALWLRAGSADIQTTAQVFEALSYRIGTVLLVLGLLHLVNVYVLNRMRQSARGERPRRAPRPPRPTLPAYEDWDDAPRPVRPAGPAAPGSPFDPPTPA